MLLQRNAKRQEALAQTLLILALEVFLSIAWVVHFSSDQIQLFFPLLPLEKGLLSSEDLGN